CSDMQKAMQHISQFLLNSSKLALFRELNMDLPELRAMKQVRTAYDGGVVEDMLNIIPDLPKEERLPYYVEMIKSEISCLARVDRNMFNTRNFTKLTLRNFSIHIQKESKTVMSEAVNAPSALLLLGTTISALSAHRLFSMQFNCAHSAAMNAGELPLSMILRPWTSIRWKMLPAQPRPICRQPPTTHREWAWERRSARGCCGLLAQGTDGLMYCPPHLPLGPRQAQLMREKERLAEVCAQQNTACQAFRAQKRQQAQNEREQREIAERQARLQDRLDRQSQPHPDGSA
ncbi:hypothetical protein PROFUN_17004, partial [Planoprotostelium fungivorum]